MRRHAAILLCLTTVVLGLRAEEPTLESLKETYEAEVQKIRDEHDAKESELLDTYGKSLETAIELFKHKGDPDTVIDAMGERDRFSVERTVPNPQNPGLTRSLQHVQANYNEALKEANIQKGKKFVALTKRYVDALDRLMKALTVEEKLDLALNVKVEKKRVEFVMADVASKLGGPTAETESKVLFPLSMKRGLVLYYGFDKYEGGLVVDKSGNGNNGQVYNTSAFSDDDRKDVFLSDGRSYVEIQGSSGLDPEAVTVCAWVKPTMYKGAIVDKTDWERKGAKGYVLRLGKDAHANFAIGTGRWQGVYSSVRIPLERWTHLLATSDGATVRLYVNGRPQGSIGTAAAMMSSRYPLRIGHGTYDKSAKRKFEGLVDEVMIWNRALSEPEIRQVYKLTGGK